VVGSQLCYAGLDTLDIEEQFAENSDGTLQRRSQWCWAAAISMMFAYYGYRVPQEHIVQRILGIPIDRPGQGFQISQALSASWRDARERRFRSHCRVFDMQSGRAELDNATIITELRSERPLIYGAQGHATLLTAVRYVRHPNGMFAINGGIVRDPWPGRGRRELSWAELRPMYVAAVRIVQI